MLKYTIDIRRGVVFDVREVNESDARRKVITIDANEEKENNNDAD